jgi:hypothetical protein
MTEISTKGVPTFQTGDSFRLQFTATDENGIARAEIKFRNTSKRRVAAIRQEIDLAGEPEVTASFSFNVNEELAPGHYVCEYIAFTDNLGNTSLFSTPGIEFRIEGDEKDHEGPALLDLSFA